MSMFDLEGMVCLVTGATEGIGRATAVGMAEQGAGGRDQPNAAGRGGRRSGFGRASGEAARSRPPSTSWTPKDPSDWSQRCGSAGSHRPLGRQCGAHRVRRCSRHRRRRAATRASGQCRAPGRFGQGSPARHGSAGRRWVDVYLFDSQPDRCPPYLAYSLAKATLNHLVRLLAVEFGAAGVRVNAIAPGVIATEGSSFIHENPAAAQAAVGKTPLARLGRPEEIAGCAVFLASLAGGFVTGQVLVADGGQVLRGVEGLVEVLAHLQAG